MTAHITFHCDRCDNSWEVENQTGTIALYVVPPGLKDLNAARILHLCPTCTAAFEGWMVSGLTIIRAPELKGSEIPRID